MKAFLASVLVLAALAVVVEPAAAAKPRVSVGDVTVGESDGVAAVEISLSKKPTRSVKVSLGTRDGTAQAGVDYDPAAPSVRFIAGRKRSASIPITVFADAIHESPDETFAVRATKVKRGKIGDGEGIVTIDDDDPEPPGGGGDPVTPTLSVTTSALAEGDPGTHARQVAVSLNAPSANTTAVDWTLAAGTATAGVDFQQAGGTVTIPAGDTAASFAVDVLGDATDEEDETLSVNLTNPAGVQPAEGSHGLTIADDDDPPTVTVTTASVPEGTSGTNARQISVGLSAASAKSLSVNYATASGTASSGGDFTAANGTLSFAPGETAKSFTVAVVGDYADETDETVAINLSNPVNVALPAAPQSVTIVDDDPPCTTPDGPGSATSLGTVNGDTDNAVHQLNQVTDIFPCADRDWFRFTLLEDSSASKDLTARIVLQSAINDSPSAGDIDLCVQVGSGGTPVCSTAGPGSTETIDVCNDEDFGGDDTTEYFVLVDGVGNAVNFNYTLTITGNVIPSATVQLSDC
jgi:hypothetical protein